MVLEGGFKGLHLRRLKDAPEEHLLQNGKVGQGLGALVLVEEGEQTAALRASRGEDGGTNTALQDDLALRLRDQLSKTEVAGSSLGELAVVVADLDVARLKEDELAEKGKGGHGAKGGGQKLADLVAALVLGLDALLVHKSRGLVEEALGLK